MLACASPALFPAALRHKLLDTGAWAGQSAGLSYSSLTTGYQGSVFPWLLLMEMLTLRVAGQPASSQDVVHRNHATSHCLVSLSPLRYMVYPYEHIQSAEQHYTTGISPSIFTDEKLRPRGSIDLPKVTQEASGPGQSLVTPICKAHVLSSVLPHRYLFPSGPVREDAPIQKGVGWQPPCRRIPIGSES